MDNFWKALTVVVAFVASAIAFGNYWVSREKFRMDLFDRRFKVFEAARRLVSYALQEGKVSQEELWTFRAGMIGKEFLFSDVVVTYLDEMDKHAVRAFTHSLAAERQGTMPLTPMQERLREEQSTAVGWLTDQLQQLQRRFAPDMKIRTSRFL